jgi:hypothetical protein
MRRSFLLAFPLVVMTACSTDTFTGVDAGDSGTGGDSSGGGDAHACVPNFCQSAKASTCNDYDQPTTPSGWSTDTSSGLSLGPEQTNVTSCPTALQIVVSPQAAPPVNQEPHAYSVAALGNPGDVTAVFDALLPTIPNAPTGIADGFVIFSLRATADGAWAVRLERSGDTAWFLRVHEGVGVAFSSPTQNILTGAWNHMSLSVHYASDASGSASLTYDTGSGPQTVTVTGHATLPNTGVSPQVTSFAIGAGVLQAPVSQSYTFLYDSISINAN